MAAQACILLALLFGSLGLATAGASAAPDCARGKCQRVQALDTALLQHPQLQRERTPQQHADSATLNAPRVARANPALLDVSPDAEQAKPKVFVGISSGPTNAKRRGQWRKQGCGERLRAAGIQYGFVIGVPTDPEDRTAKVMGEKASKHEREETEELLKESELFQDIIFTPMLDVYLDLKDKTLAIYHQGFYHAGAQYIMEADDDVCINATALQTTIAEHEAEHGSKELYAGGSLFSGTEYESQKGVDGSVTPYFSGMGSFVSRGLCKLIVEDDSAHSVLFATYGSSDEDAQTGRWVKYAKERHGIDVEFKSVPGLYEGLE